MSSGQPAWVYLVSVQGKLQFIVFSYEVSMNSVGYTFWGLGLHGNPLEFSEFRDKAILSLLRFTNDCQ